MKYHFKQDYSFKILYWKSIINYKYRRIIENEDENVLKVVLQDLPIILLDKIAY